MNDLQPLRDFLTRASRATYAGNGERLRTEKKGFIDLEYVDGDFYYRDSYAGYLASYGQETVWYQDEPVWMCSYGGGMRGSKTTDADFAHQTFGFLKAALRVGGSNDFRARGPQKFTNGHWKYCNEFTGDITNFKGHEEIFYDGEMVFEHDYFGGVVINGRKDESSID